MRARSSDAQLMFLPQPGTSDSGQLESSYELGALSLQSKMADDVDAIVVYDTPPASVGKRQLLKRSHHQLSGGGTSVSEDDHDHHHPSKLAFQNPAKLAFRCVDTSLNDWRNDSSSDDSSNRAISTGITSTSDGGLSKELDLTNGGDSGFTDLTPPRSTDCTEMCGLGLDLDEPDSSTLLRPLSIYAADAAVADTPQEEACSQLVDEVVRLEADDEGDTDSDDDEEEGASSDDEVVSTISRLSGISDLSEISGQDWKPVTRSMSWVQKQMSDGVRPRTLLEHLLPKHTRIPGHLDELTLWKIVINLSNEPPRRHKLRHVNTLDDVLHLLTTCRQIVVLTGAGVSVSCGIPDFRSRDGIYARLSKDFPDLPDPQAMFDIQYFRRDPRPFYKFAKEIYPGQFKPSLCHRFIKYLEEQGKLLRNYTQNIDTLEKVAGIRKVIECHGSFATASCLQCKYKVDAAAIREEIFNQTIPRCPKCDPAENELAIMKPDIVFFGEGLSEEFHRTIAADKDQCDLLIVIGSSLKVRPVALIPSSLPSHVPLILINRELLPHLNFDVELFGDCDIVVNEICNRLGGGWTDICYSNSQLSQLNELPPATVPAALPTNDASCPLSLLTADQATNNAPPCILSPSELLLPPPPSSSLTVAPSSDEACQLSLEEASAPVWNSVELALSELNETGPCDSTSPFLSRSKTKPDVVAGLAPVPIAGDESDIAMVVDADSDLRVVVLTAHDVEMSLVAAEPLPEVAAATTAADVVVHQPEVRHLSVQPGSMEADDETMVVQTGVVSVKPDVAATAESSALPSADLPVAGWELVASGSGTAGVDSGGGGGGNGGATVLRQSSSGGDVQMSSKKEGSRHQPADHWTPKVVARLPENSFLFSSPSRYVFHGAEVHESDLESDDDDDYEQEKKVNSAGNHAGGDANLLVSELSDADLFRELSSSPSWLSDAEEEDTTVATGEADSESENDLDASADLRSAADIRDDALPAVVVMAERSGGCSPPSLSIS